MGSKGSSVYMSVCCRRSLASRPEVIDSLRMEDPVQEAQGQVEAAPSGEHTAFCAAKQHLVCPLLPLSAPFSMPLPLTVHA